jgi:neuropeptide Y receptor type 1
MTVAQDLHWIGSVPLGGTIAAFGIIGNIISIIVWNRLIKGKLKDNKSTGIYLITLAICDTGVLVFFLLADTIKADNAQLNNNFAYAAFFAWFGFPVFFFFVVASIWMVVGVTVNRYLMIQFPTKVRKIYSGWRTYASMGLFLGFAFVINIPHFFNFHVPFKNGTYNLELTEYGNTKGSEVYEFWVHCIFLVLAPWLSIAVLNGLIIYKLNQQAKKFSEMKDRTKGNVDKTSKKDRREREMTIMLLSVTFTFLLFLLWQCVTQCLFMLGFNKDKQDTSMSWHYVDRSFAFAKLGVVVNSSINWLLYCISGSAFRKEMGRCMEQMLCGRVSLISLTQSSTRSSNLSSAPSTLVIGNEAAL